jgi:hypothetical protein
VRDRVEELSGWVNCSLQPIVNDGPGQGVKIARDKCDSGGPQKNTRKYDLMRKNNELERGSKKRKKAHLFGKKDASTTASQRW